MLKWTRIFFIAHKTPQLLAFSFLRSFHSYSSFKQWRAFVNIKGNL